MQFYVCDVHIAAASVSRLTSQGYTTFLSRERLTLTAPDFTSVRIHHEGPMFCSQPAIVQYDAPTFDQICSGMKRPLHVAATLLQNESDTLAAGTSNLPDKKAIFYHADRRSLETLFVPSGAKDIPVDQTELAAERLPYVTFSDGRA